MQITQEDLGKAPEARPFGAGARLPSGRIQRLLERALAADVRPAPVEVAYDPSDMTLPEPVRIGKRLKEYMSAQPVTVREDEELVGWLTFDGSVESDLFPRIGHGHFRKAMSMYYVKPQEGLATFEWQHSCIDFNKLIRGGIALIKKEIAESKAKWTGNQARLDYLRGMELTVEGIERRIENCAAECRRQAAAELDCARKARLLEMAERVERVPMNPAATFLDGVQSVYFCFDFLADAVGRLDQYLAPLYFADIANGTLTKERAEEALQELFIYIDAHTPHASDNYHRTAESHMTVGGLTPDGRDGWTEFSQLVVESALALNLKRPQLSFRWHPGTKRETLRFILDCERKDPNLRVAMDGDLPRIEGYTQNFGFSVEEARDYCMTGCNECIFMGGVSQGGCKFNAARCINRVFTLRRDAALACRTWDDFRKLFKEEFFHDLQATFDWCNRFNKMRAGDCNVLSALFLTGCIERAESPTRGGASRALAQIFVIGSANLIDSLSIVRQFVFEEKRCTMADLAAAIDADWQGYGDLREEIAREGRFYGTNDPLSNEMAQLVHASLAEYARPRRDIFGNQWDFGNLAGYHDHGAKFGAVTGATPDGRKAGEMLSFGSGPAINRGCDAATSALLSAARMDPGHAMCGGAIMNLSLPPSTASDERDFEKAVALVETYFREGGMHLQLNHVTRETLLDAQRHPEKYPDLRVRVSGFSGYFVRFKKTTQDEIIGRTVAKP